MSDSAHPIRSSHRCFPLTETRPSKSAPGMCTDLPQPNTLPNLETVSTGKGLAQRVKKRGPKCRMDPELQELKGFMELGFEFRKDQLTPRLLILLPGLKRLVDHENSTQILGFEESPSENWKLPSPNVAEENMKEYLKLWARSVASTLK